MAFSQKFTLNDKILFAAISILLLHFLSLVILNADAYFYIHDTLDGEIPYLHMLTSTNKMFDFSGNSVLENVMNGIPRSAFRSGLDLTPLWFSMMPPHIAYIFNYILVHTVGFIGMYLLLKTYFVPDEKLQWVVVLTSLAFSFAGYYTIYGITTSGLPLLAWAFLNLAHAKPNKWISYLVIALFVFWSLSFLIAPFILFSVMVYFIYDAIKYKRINWNLVLGSIFYVALVALVNYQLIVTTLAKSGFISHRVEWQETRKTTSDFIRIFIKFIVRTHYHVGIYLTPLIILVALLGWYYNYNRTGKKFNPIAMILVANVLIAFYYPLSYLLVEKYGDAFPVIKVFNTNRFYFLLSFSWLLVFAIAIQELVKAGKFRAILPWVAVVQFILVAIDNPEVKNNTKLLFGSPINEPVYSQYVAKDVYSQVAAYIGKPQNQYRIVNVGIDPAPSQLNNFYTLDSYQNNYPLSYKHEFRKIIAPELDKNKELQEFYDRWGSRCYIFLDELGKDWLYGKNRQIEIKNMNLNTQQIKLMGGEYILSTLKIDNAAQNNLVFEKRFTSPKAYMDIYLYKIQ